LRSTSHTGFSEEQQTEIGQGNDRWLEQSELDDIGRRAETWLTNHTDAVSKLAIGTILIINVATGEYVAAPSEDQAEAEFQGKFGRRVRGFVHRVGRPTTIGGGWWALHKAR